MGLSNHNQQGRKGRYFPKKTQRKEIQRTLSFNENMPDNMFCTIASGNSKRKGVLICVPPRKKVLDLQARTRYDYKENKENYWKTQLTLSDDGKQVKPVFLQVLQGQHVLEFFERAQIADTIQLHIQR